MARRVSFVISSGSSGSFSGSSCGEEVGKIVSDECRHCSSGLVTSSSSIFNEVTGGIGTSSRLSTFSILTSEIRIFLFYLLQ